jgi:signal transduction histidine kinase/CheY-like chemotaxis protein
MWQVESAYTQINAVQEQEGRELLQSTLTNLVRTLIAIYLVWHIIATTSWPLATNWELWCVSLLVITTCAMTLLLVKSRFLLAFMILHTGLALSITVAIYLFQWPELAFFYVLLPLLSALILSWQAALISQAFLCVLIGLSSQMATQPAFVPAPSLYLNFVIIMSGLFFALIGSVATMTLTTVTQWSLYSIAQAQEKIEEARQHRGQLVNLLKQLDQAYYQLERTNAELVVARESAEKAERFKAEFVTHVSHELRTPLNLIIGFTEMMVHSPESYDNVLLPGPYRSDLNAMQHSAQHLLTLVDDVLDLARIEAGKIALAREEVNMQRLVAETTSIVRDYIVAKGLTLEVDVEQNLPPLWIDRLRIRQTLLNLLVNAARHTEQGWIHIDVHRQDGEVLIRVTDSGPGIPEDEQTKLFQEFHSTEQPSAEWHSGTGLGLPISKKFVELHQGKMGVQSVYGLGSCFWFTLPGQSPSNHASISSQPSDYHPLVQVRASERTVVVVHDSQQIVALVKRYLESFQVIGAGNMAEGQRLAEENKAVAILVGDGEAVPVSSNSFLTIQCPLPSSHLTATRLGGHDLLLKPVSRHELLAAIDKLPHPIQRVLIVDDNPEIVRMFRRMLHSRVPFENCIEAYNGAEALELMQAKRPDLVLLDLIMPVVDGRSVLNQMATNADLAQTPVILITARGQDHTDLRVSGAIMLNKPGGFELGEVIRTLEITLNLLAPGWQPSGSNASIPEEMPAELRVSPNRQPLPT